MRDDTAATLKKIGGLYNEKKKLLVQMADRCRFQSSLLDTEDFSAISESINENSHLISLMDSLDYEISATLDELRHITGMDKKMLSLFLEKNDESETAALREHKNECTATLNTAFALFNNFLEAVQIKAQKYLTDFQELERIARVKELL
ncbi:MAG: hypothetical protein FWG13_05245 [Leptospirales bacterium]|nr:hypothetical protein [Leptospirales bacterium]